MSALSRRALLGLGLPGGLAAVAGCGSSGDGSARSGTVNVLYAGSLVALMEQQIGPAYEKETGFKFAGFSGGSTALAAQIKGKVRRADVFLSASPDADAELMGAQNGDWVRWYVTYATAPLVLGFNSKSAFAARIEADPWYDVIALPDFRIGSTDPRADPKGKLAHQALQAAGKDHPKLLEIAANDKTIFPEEALVADVQSGQLDAGFFYSSEAKLAGLPTVQLTGQALKATYTATVVRGAPNEAGAEAFVAHLLGSRGRAVLQRDGFELAAPPTVTGSGVPAAVRKVLPGT